jgi:PAS domain S-box-containing protein
MVADRQGTVLARLPDPQDWVGKSFPDAPLIKALLSHTGEGAFEETGLDGVRRLYAYSTPHTGHQSDTRLVVGLPKALAVADADRFFFRSLIILGIFTVLILAATRLVAEFSVLKPVKTLLRATQRLSSGDLKARIGMTDQQDELGRLASSFDEMADSLERYVSEHRRIEENLRHSEAKYRELVNQVNDGFFVLDREGIITFANQTLAQLHGLENPDDLVGHPFSDLIPDGIKTEQWFYFRDMAEGKNYSELITSKLSRTDGKELTIEIKSTAIIRDKQVVGVRGVIRDITERRNLEEQLRQSQKIEAIGRLAGGVAHDFNNLLTAMLGYSEILLSRLSPEDSLRSEVEEIRKSALRAASLTSQLLAFSRKQVLQPKVINLNSIVVDMEKMLRRLIGEDIELKTITPSDLGNIMADPGQIEQVILNLAVNAKDAMPQGGKLIIETANISLDQKYASRHTSAKPGEYVMLAASDTGYGMDQETVTRIFEPFFTTKGPGKGTGLGLSTVYGIVKQSGGNIWVYSEPGKGTTFKIYLPLVKLRADQYVQQAAAGDKYYQGTETILLVEDEESVRNLVRRILSQQGYTVFEALNAQQALKIAQSHRANLDLLLTDIVMPGMTGLGLAQRMLQFHPEIRILYMSGYTDSAVLQQGWLESGSYFLQKPFTPEALSRKVREILGVPQALSVG